MVITIAQRDIAQVPTTYGQLQVEDRIKVDGQMCTLLAVNTVADASGDYTVVTAKGDYYGIMAYAKPSNTPAVRSSRNA